MEQKPRSMQQLEGEKAFRDGKKMYECPYPINVVKVMQKRADWRRGWHDAYCKAQGW